MISDHQTACFSDLPGDLVGKIAASLTARDRARLMSCAKPIWQLSYSLGGLWEELEFSFSLQKAQALLPFLQRRRHLVHSLTLSLYYLTPLPSIAVNEGELLQQLVQSLADGTLRKLTAHLDRGVLTLGSWLAALPHLNELSISCGGASPVTLAASLSCLTTLTSLEVWDCYSVLPEGCLPTSLRSLALSIQHGGHPSLPAAVAAATGLEQLTVESPLDDAEGLQRLQNLTSLTLATGEVGVPDQVEELIGLRSLKVLPEVVYAEQLALLTKLTNLTSLTLEPEDGADAGMILAPLPSELLDLPHLLEMKIEAAIPPLSISGPIPVAPSLQVLALCIAALASSPATLAALTSLTSLHLSGLYDEDNCPPLTTAAVTTLMLTLPTLPRLASLTWAASFPLEGAAAARLAQAQAPAGDAAGAGHAAAGQAPQDPQQDPQQPNQHQQQATQQAAGPQQLPSAASAPAWLELIEGGFPALVDIEITFADPGDLWGSTVGAEQLSPWLGLPVWLGCMRGLKRAKLVAACEEAGALGEGLPPGVALQTSRY